MNRGGRGGGPVPRQRTSGDRSRGGGRFGRPAPPSETWVMPRPFSRQQIPPLAAPAAGQPFPERNAIVALETPKAPGRVSFAKIQCYTNYYLLHLGEKWQVCYFYTVKMSQAEESSEQASKKAPTTHSRGPRRERKLNLQLKKEIFDALRHRGLHDFVLVYDGRQRAVSLERLPHDALNQTIAYDNDLWNVTLSYEKAVPLEGLRPGEGFGRSENEEEARLALSLIMGNVALRMGTTPVGKGYYGLPGEAPIPIGDGLALWSGFKFHIILGAEKLYLNVNLSIAAFVEQGRLIDLLPSLIGLSQAPAKKLHPQSIRELRNKLTRCRAETTHFKRRPQMKLTINSITDKSASEIEFEDKNGDSITVSKYFAREYGPLKYPDWPCVKVGHAHFPLEVVAIRGSNPFRGEHTRRLTRDIVQTASIPPRNRLEEIRDTVRKLASKVKVDKEFDFEISKELEVPGRILPVPALLAAGSKPVTVNPGVLDFRGTKFLSGSSIKRWTVVNTDPKNKPGYIKAFVDALIKQSLDIGIHLAAPLMMKGREFHFISEKLEIRKVEESIEKLVRKNDLEFLCVIISDDSPIRMAIKSLSDVKLGFRSKHVKSSTIGKILSSDRGPSQILVNILYGLNLKFNGENVVGAPTEFAANLLRTSATLIIGLDVNHGHAKVRYGRSRTPSTIGIVGTRNMNATLYNAFMTAQRKPSTSSDTEIIQAQVLKPEVEKLIRLFSLETGRKPERIIVYRDGVSNGQFNAVVQTEVRAIVEVCEEIFGPAQRPPITFLTVQKRHDGLLFPTKVTLDWKGREKQNPIAGTVVDETMTSPSVRNYFLVTHEAIQGTSRPPHHTVLVDENKFDNDQLQSLTYYLCHLYGKCPRSVSIPTPVYYAHHAAFRAQELGASELSKNRTSFGRDQVDEEELHMLNEYRKATHVDESHAGSMYFL